MQLDRLLPFALAVLVAACSSKEAAPAAPAPDPGAPTVPTTEGDPEPIQAPSPLSPTDTFETERGPLTLTPIHHGTVAMRFEGKTIVVDPWSKAPEGWLPEADLLLLTDIHQDHLDPAAIESVRTASTVIIAPRAVADSVEGARVLANGEETTAIGITVRAVPMYNLEPDPETGEVRHEKGRGNGYLLDFAGTRVYLAGDTACTPEMKALEDIDVALLPMNMPYTMPPEEAAACVEAFRPEVVIPYHYRGSDLEVFASALRDVEGVEVRLRDFYAEPAAR